LRNFSAKQATRALGNAALNLVVEFVAQIAPRLGTNGVFLVHRVAHLCGAHAFDKNTLKLLAH
jgi:hypothetical protein